MRVFSVEHIRNPSATIPSAEDFQNALTDFEQCVDEELARGTITGALTFGSVAIRGYGLTSDYDCVIVPRDHSLECQEALDRIVTTTSQAGRIEVNPIVHSEERLASGNHEIDRYFGQHLTGSSRIVHGNDPASYIRFANLAPLTIMTMYLQHKMRSIAPGMLPGSAEYYKGLQRILELPLAIGRKALRALDEVNGTALATSDTANRAVLTPAVIELFDSFELGDTARSLLDLGQSYKQCLANVLDGTATEQDYVAIVAEIRARGSDASHWLDQLDPILTSKLSQDHEIHTLPVA